MSTIAPPPRVQFVVSGRCLILLLLAVGLLGGGYYWYTQQQEIQKRFHTPPYFVNHGPTVIRPCTHCAALGKLKPQPEWEIGSPTEIPATEQRWFLAVEDPALPVAVAGLLLLPAYPSLRDNPSFGFDQTTVVLVLYQNLRRMPWIEQSPPPQPAALSTPTQDSALEAIFLGDWKNEDPETRDVTRFLVAANQGKLVVQAWGKCFPTDCDWQQADANLTDGGLSVLWNFGFSNRTWKLSPDSEGRLQLSEHTHYTDSRTDRDETAYFIRSTEGQQ